jgi:hypothetical protein
MRFNWYRSVGSARDEAGLMGRGKDRGTMGGACDKSKVGLDLDQDVFQKFTK